MLAIHWDGIVQKCTLSPQITIHRAHVVHNSVRLWCACRSSFDASTDLLFRSNDLSYRMQITPCFWHLRCIIRTASSECSYDHCQIVCFVFKRCANNLTPDTMAHLWRRIVCNQINSQRNCKGIGCWSSQCMAIVKLWRVTGQASSYFMSLGSPLLHPHWSGIYIKLICHKC